MEKHFSQNAAEKSCMSYLLEWYFFSINDIYTINIRGIQSQHRSNNPSEHHWLCFNCRYTNRSPNGLCYYVMVTVKMALHQRTGANSIHHTLKWNKHVARNFINRRFFRVMCTASHFLQWQFYQRLLQCKPTWVEWIWRHADVATKKSFNEKFR